MYLFSYGDGAWKKMLISLPRHVESPSRAVLYETHVMYTAKRARSPKVLLLFCAHYIHVLHLYVIAMYSRRSSRRQSSHADASGSTNHGQRSSHSRREHVRVREEEQEAMSGKRKKNHSHDTNGHRNSRRRAEAEDEDEGEEEEENREEGDDEGEEDEEAGEEVDESGQYGQTDGGLWGLAPIKKLTVSKTAREAAEKVGSEEIKRKGTDLARMALFCEQRRVVLKREDITKKVLIDKDSAKAFPVVFNRAQKILLYTFGYEMVELRLKGTDNEQLAQTNQEQEDGADGAKGPAKSKTYILRSVLPTKVIAKMAVPTASLAEAVNGIGETMQGDTFDGEGTIVDWKRSSSDLANMGLLYLILSLIMLNGRTMSDDQLQSYLRRISLDANRVLPDMLQPGLASASTESRLTMDEYLDLLIKQSYLECVRSGSAPQGAMSMDGASLAGKRVQARGRKSKADDEQTSGQDREWRWGARAEAEITEKAVGEFVAEVYLTSDAQERAEEDDHEEEEDAASETTARQKARETLMKHIEHAAGSQLIS